MCSSFSIEVRIKYAEGVTLGKKTIRKNLFVIVSTEEEQTYNNNHQNQVITKLCEDDEVHPTWNQKLTTTIPTRAKFINLDVCQKTRSKVKSIGTAKVPVSDFVGEYMPQNYMHFLSYRLRDCHGEPNGIINFCVIVKGVFGHQYYGQNYKASGIQGYNNNSRSSCSNQNQSHRLEITKPINGRPYNFNEVVVGVPADWSNSWLR